MMNRILRMHLVISVLLAGFAGSSFGDPMNEARAVGQGSINTIYGGINTADSNWSLTAIQASPGGDAPYGIDPNDAGVAGAAVQAECAANPDARVECAGINAGTETANAGVYQNAGQIVPPDVNKLTQGQLPLDAALEGMGIGGAYSECNVGEITEGQKYFDEQSCHNYYSRVQDKPCTKTLDVKVNWKYTCPPGKDGPFVTDPNWAGGNPVPHHCTFESFNWEQYCEEGKSLEWSPNVGWRCFDDQRVASATLWKKVFYTDWMPATATAVETDVWTNPCAGDEVRVPPGLLLPDGVNPDGDSVPYPIATGPGPKNKCERTTSWCIQPRQDRIINNHKVTRNCWAFTNTFTCLDLDSKSDCDQPRWGDCTELGTQCVEFEPLSPDMTCITDKTTYSCMVEDTTRKVQVTDCGTQVYKDANGVVWDTAHEPDTDFASVIAYMEAGREAGAYIDPDTLEVFKGFKSTCRKKLWGLVNCCNKGGSSSGMFSNGSIAAASTAGSALASTYTFDALFASNAPNWVIHGFSSLFGSGTSSALAGLLTGNVTMGNFLTSLVPGPWTVVMLVIQLSGLLDCEDPDIETAIKRDARLCVELGTYCSKKTKILGTCLERTNSFCCFNSRLAKAINTQGKAALGLNMGTAKQPNCGGFTAAQLQTLDLSTMDLSEFMDQIIPNEELPAATSCYFEGETSCPAVH